MGRVQNKDKNMVDAEIDSFRLVLIIYSQNLKVSIS